jgi:HD-GYP domain-containing protein (c-di-GMP phosphodiesterase class II)
MQFSPLSSLKHRVSVGIPLPFNVRDADETLILARGKIVGNLAQLQALFDRGALVDVAELLPPMAQVTSAKREELPKLWTQCFERVGQTLRGSAEPGFADAMNEACTPALDLISRDPDLAVFQVLRQSGSANLDYGLTHSMHTAITSLLVAQRLGWSADESKRAFQAALTMNVAMVELQGILAAQTTPPTDAQRRAVFDHPAASVALLERAGITDIDWLRAVEQHHETTDGSGYPKGLREPTELAGLLRRADIYTTKLSPRVGREAMAADQAGRDMFMQDPGHPMSVALAKEFGVYPPGCFVKLKSGEIAVVVKRGDTVMTPWVAALTSVNGMPLREPLPRDTSLKDNAIACVVSETSVPVRLKVEQMMQIKFG